MPLEQPSRWRHIERATLHLSVRVCDLLDPGIGGQDRTDEKQPIRGTFLLRHGREQRAWEFVQYLEQNFLVSHKCGEPLGEPFEPTRGLSEDDLIGVKFFDGDDRDCSSGECCSILKSEPGTCEPPVNFDDEDVISHQPEATLDYVLFLHEFALATHRMDRRAFAESRRDQLLYELVKFYNTCSAGGGLPVSSRAIHNLFTSFDGSLASAQARIVWRILDRPDLRFLYRGALQRRSFRVRAGRTVR